MNELVEKITDRLLNIKRRFMKCVRLVLLT